MGLFGGLKKAIFGGGGDKPFKPKYTGEYEQGSRQGVYNRIGATPTVGADGKTTYDFSNVGKQVSSETANSPYAGSYSQVGSLTRGLSNPAQLKETYSTGYKPAAYNPYQFNFGSDKTINDATDLQYGMGSKNINRQSSSALEQQRESIGTRRPGLLLKAAEDNQRNTGENLASLGSGLRSTALQQKLSLGQAQQQAQAGENFNASQFGDQQQLALAEEMYKGYGSRADNERGNVDNSMRGKQSAIDAILNKVNTQRGVTDSERDYQDKGLEYLQDMYKSSAGLNNNAAQLNGQKKSGALGFLSGAAGIASKFI